MNTFKKFKRKSINGTISVVMPAYNRAGLIGETLRSLFSQTVPAKEIIVVNDGSTDGTVAAVLRFAAENGGLMAEDGVETATRPMADGGQLRADFENHNIESTLNDPLSAIRYPLSITAKPRLRLIRQANAGPGAARNRGLAEASGEYIHFFDSDDIAAPNKHEVQLRALLETGADIAYGAWVKGRFVENERPMTDSGPVEYASHSTGERELMADSAGGAKALDARLWTLDSGPRNFVPEGPVLQAHGLPEGDLIKALLTNWSVVPHACLFRRSILDKAGGFPEDIWVGEDQLLFLRCLLAGARVVHTPGTMVYYRVGDDPGKLTATGAAQKRHARDWGRFLLSAKKEIEDRRSEIGEVPAETRRRGDFLCGAGPEELGGREVSHGVTANTEGAQGCARGTRAGASEPDLLTSKLARDSENTSLIRSASGPVGALRARSSELEDRRLGEELVHKSSGGEGSGSMSPIGQSSCAGAKPELPVCEQGRVEKGESLNAESEKPPATSYSLLATAPEALTTPSAWFGFRLRAYEAWRDLESFFPDGEGELKENLKRIFLEKRKFPKAEMLKYQVSGFLIRKFGGVKLRLLGYRENYNYFCSRYI